ncbi:hypothetical protein SB773_15255 [Bacillus sp. SIMBA_074]|uniref:hypothetical protein n=1 Tax=Bacillus sp. SIMBA_074 TaxID=3085812 RepID=UPI00397CCF05
MKQIKKYNQRKLTKKWVANDEEILFEEENGLGLEDEDLEEENDLGPEDEDLEEENDLGPEDEDLEEENDLGPEDEDLEEEDDLGLEDEELEEEDDLGLEDEELEEEDDLGLEDEELEEEDAYESKSTKQVLKNVGLTVSSTAQKELDEQLEEFLSTKVTSFPDIGNKGSSFLSIVKADTGTSIRLTKDATAKLNNPTRLSVGFTGKNLVLCNADELNVSSYKGSFKNGRTIVYNTGLVEAIIKQFNLDFSNKTSISFSEGYYKQQGRVILYVKLGQKVD